MRLRPDVETVGTVAALLICAAFVASFALGLGMRGSAPRAPAADAPSLTPGRVAGRIEVLNGSGRAGAARTATDMLRSGGFDVVYYGNAPGGVQDTSVVLDRVGNAGFARMAARRLGVQTVRTELDSSLYLDATVVLGRDWLPRR